jgi:hypothetical protein
MPYVGTVNYYVSFANKFGEFDDNRIVAVLPVGKITFWVVKLKKLETITSVSYAII